MRGWRALSAQLNRTLAARFRRRIFHLSSQFVPADGFRISLTFSLSVSFSVLDEPSVAKLLLFLFLRHLPAYPLQGLPSRPSMMSIKAVHFHLRSPFHFFSLGDENGNLHLALTSFFNFCTQAPSTFSDF